MRCVFGIRRTRNFEPGPATAFDVRERKRGGTNGWKSKWAIGDVTQQESPALIVNLFEGVEAPGGATGAVDSALGGVISGLISDGEVSGGLGELTLIHTPNSAYPSFSPARVLVAGLGKQGAFGYDTIRRVTASALRKLEGASITHAVTIVHGAGIGGLDPAASAAAIAEGAILGLYKFDKYKSKSNDEKRQFESLTLVDIVQDNRSLLEAGVERGETYARAGVAARDMVNEPANLFPPSKMAETACDVARAAGLGCNVLEQEDVEKTGYGRFSGRCQWAAASRRSSFICRTRETRTTENNNIWLVGKGITFDTGGISLKPPGGMSAMKGDMGGGAAVIGAIGALARLKPRINVHAVVAATENMPGASAQRPGDVVTAMNGKTIEVDNTDAEGRLTLADAICYAKSKGASRIVDVATLTGAAAIALGRGQSAVFSNNDELVDAVIARGRRQGRGYVAPSIWTRCRRSRTDRRSQT